MNVLKSKVKISGSWIAIFVLILVPSIVYGDKFFSAVNAFNVLRQDRKSTRLNSSHESEKK